MQCRKIVITVFLNLLFFSIFSYVYLLRRQPLFKSSSSSSSSSSNNSIKLQIGQSNIDFHSLSFDEQIYYYNRGYFPQLNKTGHTSISSNTRDSKHNSNVVYVNNNKPPRMANSKWQYMVNFNASQYRCRRNATMKNCNNQTKLFRDKILAVLTGTYLEESLQQKWTNKSNPYNVQYNSKTENYLDKTRKEVLCELMNNAELQTIKKSDLVYNNSSQTDSIRNYLPNRNLFEKKHFNSCVMVASSGSLRHSNLGHFIDSHDFILRFNHAPTKGYEIDVGRKTSLRILNSQVVTKPEYKFLESPLYRNVVIVIWDPSNYSIPSLDEWMRKPDFNFIPNFIRFKKLKWNKSRIFIINPLSIWKIWNVLQQNFPNILRRNPPSSGFLGLYLLLSKCNIIDIVEYVPSVRLTNRCHYYDPENNLTCTFGVWHPLAAEKLLTYYLNNGSDYDVFQNGFVRINGFRNIKKC